MNGKSLEKISKGNRIAENVSFQRLGDRRRRDGKNSGCLWDRARTICRRGGGGPRFVTLKEQGELKK